MRTVDKSEMEMAVGQRMAYATIPRGEGSRIGDGDKGVDNGKQYHYP